MDSYSAKKSFLKKAVSKKKKDGAGGPGFKHLEDALRPASAPDQLPRMMRGMPKMLPKKVMPAPAAAPDQLRKSLKSMPQMAPKTMPTPAPARDLLPKKKMNPTSRSRYA